MKTLYAPFEGNGSVFLDGREYSIEKGKVFLENQVAQELLSRGVGYKSEKKFIKENKRVLLLLGEGLGNIIQNIVLIPNLKGRYEKVDVLIVKENYPISDLLVSEVGNVWNSNNWGFIRPDYYDYRVETLWGSCIKIQDYEVKKVVASIPLLNEVTGQKFNSISSSGRYDKTEYQLSLDILEELGFDKEQLLSDIRIELPKREKKYDIVLANTSRNFTDWDFKRYKYWQELAHILKHAKGYNICSVGGEYEYIPGTANETDLSILETCSIIDNSKLVVTNDSGIYHLSNLLKKENIVIFTGSSIEKNYDKRFHKYSHLIYKPCEKRPICQFTKEWSNCKQGCREVNVNAIVSKVDYLFSGTKVLVALATYNGNERLKKFLKSIYNSKNKNKFDLFILDDSSSKGVNISKRYPVILQHRIHSSCIGEVKTDLIGRILQLDYDYYYLTDDDYSYKDGWLDRCIELEKMPNVGISTVFCHPKDYENYKFNQENNVYYPKSTMGGSIFISKRLLKLVFEKKKEYLKNLIGLWDYSLTNSVLEFGKKIISVTDSLVQHNPWELPGYYKRTQTKGLNYDNKDLDLVSIIILCHNQLEYTKKCIESIRKYTEDISYELIVVDNGSNDGTLEYLKNILDCNDKIIRNKNNLGFSIANNRAVKRAKGKYILFLNNDVIVGEDWLYELYCNRSSASIVGSSMCINEPTNMGMFIYKGKIDQDSEWAYIEGWCMLIKKGLFESMGGFDEIFNPVYCEDADLCYRVKKIGGNIKRIPTNIQHFRNTTVRADIVDRDSIIKEHCKLLWQKHCSKSIKKEIAYA